MLDLNAGSVLFHPFLKNVLIIGRKLRKTFFAYMKIIIEFKFFKVTT